MRLIVQPPFKHTQDNIVIAADEAPHFGGLTIGQFAIDGLPLIGSALREIGQHGVCRGIELAVDVEDEMSEVGKSSRLRNSRAADEQNLTARMGQK